MRAVQFKFIVLLSLVYLGLVGWLYSVLWKSHAFNLLLEAEDHDNHEDVQFDFKRLNKPLVIEDRQHPLNTTVEATALSTIAPATTDAYRKTNPSHSSSHSKYGPPNYCLHVFYYLWYGNTEKDGHYYHWNHRYLPHWDQNVAKRYPLGRHVPPDDVAANFYPALGPYSSKDPTVIEKHMRQLRQAGIGVLCVSWYPPGLSDDEGPPPDTQIPLLLDIAHNHSIAVAIHIEPYRDRSPRTVRKDLEYIHERYSLHPAFHKIRTASHGDQLRPIVYLYDSYLSPAQEWAELLSPRGSLTIRGTPFDMVAIGLLVEESHKNFITVGGFDGFYTYFASNMFTYGSTSANWKAMSTFAKANNLLFIPSVGPGYEDTRVRPWNAVNSKGREGGSYYDRMFGAALGDAQATVISVTSFNEWHEGTQIEPALPKSAAGFTYLDYLPHAPDFYLEKTRQFSQQLHCNHA